MRAKVVFSVAGAVIAAVALVSASGAATAKTQKMTRIDVSTRTAVVHFLRSIHVSAKGAVIQRGGLNYAGAHCPGVRWICASTQHTVVQIARRGGQNRFVCRSANCSVVQISGVSHGVLLRGRQLASTAAVVGTNTATCFKTTGLTQSCSITQSNSGSNIAGVYEDAANKAGLAQTASYTASINQSSSGGDNRACVHQVVTLVGSTNMSGSKANPINVALEAHQGITITQNAANGHNYAAQNAQQSSTSPCTGSRLIQTQTLTSVAGGSGASSVTQNENAANSGPNLTLDIEQNKGSAFGSQNSTGNDAVFTQTNTLSAVAFLPGGSVSQTQSSSSGGIFAKVNQDAHGVSIADANQQEAQCEDAYKSTSQAGCSTSEHTPPAGLSVLQTQTGPVSKAPGDSSQTGNSGDSFTVTQSSRQDSDTGSTQANFVTGGFHTDGHGTVTQTTTVDGKTSTGTQAGSGDVSGSTTCTGSTCTSTTTPPPPTITSNPGSTSSSSSASFSFDDADSFATFLCQVDNSGYSACTSPWTYGNLADGPHTFSVEATNGTGTSTPTTWTWTISGGGASATTVSQLNPTSDPIDPAGTCTDWIASGTGFNGTPQKVTDITNLGAYDGQAIQLRFSFSTRDANFNAFQGWYLNNITVTGTQSGNPVTTFSDPVAAGDTTFTASGDHGVAPGWHVTASNSTMGPAWWYGNDATGTYQTPGSGDSCVDPAANAGTITTPVLTLASNSQLSFDTLWQIEGVNPSGFDLMQVQVIPVSSGPPIG